LFLRSPYLLGIAAYVTLLATANTFLYFEQLRLVETTFSDTQQRTSVFARIDWIVQSLTILAQLFITGRVASRLGVVVLLTIIPVAIFFGFVALAIWNSFVVLAVVIVLRRSGEYAFVRPGREMLWSPRTKETKYKAKNFVDVPVYRGADAVVAQLQRAIEGAGSARRRLRYSEQSAQSSGLQTAGGSAAATIQRQRKNNARLHVWPSAFASVKPAHAEAGPSGPASARFLIAQLHQHLGKRVDCILRVGSVASRVAVAPHSNCPRRMSIRLVAENRSPFRVIVISERKLFALRTNSAAGRAWNPCLFEIVISRVTRTGARFCRHNIIRCWLRQTQGGCQKSLFAVGVGRALRMLNAPGAAVHPTYAHPARNGLRRFLSPGFSSCRRLVSGIFRSPPRTPR
jgi:hypothetical protein